MALFYCLMSDLKKPHHLKNTCWKDHYLLDALKTSLSTLYCFTMKASNTEAKLIHQHIQQNGSFHFAMHSAAERKQSASFVNFQFISNSSFENIQSSEDREILHKPWLCPVFQATALLVELAVTNSEKTTDGVFLHRKKRTSVTHVLRGSTCAFCFFLVCLLTHCWKTTWGGVYLTVQLNSVGVCITCAGMETVWKDPTAPQTCKR